MTVKQPHPQDLPPLPSISKAWEEKAYSFTPKRPVLECPVDSDNKGLEFLGDALLAGLVTEVLYDHFPRMRPHYCAMIRSELVSNKFLAKLSDSYNLLQKGLKGPHYLGGKKSAKIFEAYLAAVYLDRGRDTCRDWVFQLFKPYIYEYYEILKAETQKTDSNLPISFLNKNIASKAQNLSSAHTTASKEPQAKVNSPTQDPPHGPTVSPSPEEPATSPNITPDQKLKQLKLTYGKRLSLREATIREQGIRIRVTLDEKNVGVGVNVLRNRAIEDAINAAYRNIQYLQTSGSQNSSQQLEKKVYSLMDLGVFISQAATDADALFRAGLKNIFPGNLTSSKCREGGKSRIEYLLDGKYRGIGRGTKRIARIEAAINLINSLPITE